MGVCGTAMVRRFGRWQAQQQPVSAFPQHKGVPAKQGLAVSGGRKKMAAPSAAVNPGA